MELAQITLRRKESAFLAGGTKVGKSTLSECLRADYLARYERSWVHIADTKPRYRAQWRITGRPAKALYKNWSHGAFVPDSVLVASREDMDTARTLGFRTTICQSRRWAPAQDECAAWFYDHAKRGVERLLIVDETVDHFHSNGTPRGTGAIVDAARSGNEQTLAGLYCSQRTKGVSPILMECMEKLYAFALDVQGDAMRYGEFGAPVVMVRERGRPPRPMWFVDDRYRPLPTERHQFTYWTKADRGHVWGPYTLGL